ncbi:hypothetical protein AVEN_105511-1 [Araneus ventricosus]|uniref:Uncharacterized protein n=1 Tax=Araneus ventricosus TaxID=182803 RepID=A0A4Y2GLI5_ARAVE|nr:hypothetical protein AVEN_105511-1 [Araneus ventricosus]
MLVVYEGWNFNSGNYLFTTEDLQQKRYMLPSFTVLQCSHQHCVQPVASDVEVSSACCVDSSNEVDYCLKNLWNSSEENATK